MSSLINAWKILLLWMLPCYHAEDEGIYECGAHGRFEYCIDGIPGCVIGCHCHPGYFFDTESKICEPNIKLTQNYRRQYILKPTRVQNPSFESKIADTELLPTLTTQNIIDEHVNDITKNADDLGDWLYNQFFKTIENQVINKTSKDNKLTRRSERGSSSKTSKMKRRARRKGSKNRKKKKGLQGKLLRIAEDDSLFQSSDSSDSDTSSREYRDSDSSVESDSGEDHGHKKILLINKKPKPPLPSFIFLPNMNTAYYPPIGLPPPPIMPMYPMVPVPPMMPAPPQMPVPGNTPGCDENTTSDKTEITVPTTKVTTVETEATVTSSVAETTDVETNITSTDAPPLRNRYRGRNKKRIKSHENMADYDDELPSDNYEPSRDNRQKLIKRLRQKMNYPRTDSASLTKYKKPFDKYMNQLVPPDTLTGNEFSDDNIIKDVKSSPANLQNTPDFENVDFKYLSQLIHRVNETQTQKLPTNNYNIQMSPKMVTPRKWFNKRYHDFSDPFDSARRINQETMFNNSRIPQTDDTYYSNLGRQIAALIRTIDADKERQFNIEIEKVQQNTNDHPYFNENRPHTFWERSIRSPLTYFHTFKHRYDKVKNSNELLFNIENKVETIASTVPPLSLHDLENLINVMRTARTQLQSKTNVNNMPSPNKTLNVNLWPQEVIQSNAFENPTDPNSFNVKRRKTLNDLSTRTERLKPNNIGGNFPYPLPKRVKLQKTNDVYVNSGLQMNPALRNMSKMYIHPMNFEREKAHKPIFRTQPRHSMSPTILNYKNIKKYFFDNGNQYSFQNDNVPQYSPASRTFHQKNPSVSSPYFHHEINHIDYIS